MASSNKARAAYAVAALALAAAAAGAWWGYAHWWPIHQVKQQVAAQLSDPESARFESVTITDIGVACGRLNARNRMGGYVGYRRFFLTADGDLDIEPDAATSTDLERRVIEARLRLDFLKSMQAAGCPDL